MLIDLHFWLWSATAAAVVFGLGALMRLNERLRSKHFAVWTSLGQPESFAYSFERQIGTMRLMKFVLWGDYKTLDDITVNRLARAVIYSYLLGIVGVVAFWALAYNQ